MIDGYQPAIPTVATAMSGLGTVLVNWVVPISAAVAGLALGKQLADSAAAFVSSWFPYIDVFDKWVGDRSLGAMKLPYLIAGIAVLVFIIVVDRVLYHFMGSWWPAFVARRGLMAFGIGVAIRCILESFVPLKATILKEEEKPLADPIFGSAPNMPITQSFNDQVIDQSVQQPGGGIFVPGGPSQNPGAGGTIPGSLVTPPFTKPLPGSGTSSGDAPVSVPTPAPTISPGGVNAPGSPVQTTQPWTGSLVNPPNTITIPNSGTRSGDQVPGAPGGSSSQRRGK